MDWWPASTSISPHATPLALPGSILYPVGSAFDKDSHKDD